MQLFPRTAALLCLGLAACAAPYQAPAPLPAPALMAGGDVTPGFDDREPDTCKAQALAGLVGQPSGMLRTVPVAGPVRIIGPGTVYDQEEYRSDRINAFTDGKGIILRVACG